MDALFEQGHGINDQKRNMDEFDLNLSAKGLAMVPADILAARPLLHFLDLSNNGLTELPDALCDLRSLYVSRLTDAPSNHT